MKDKSTIKLKTTYLRKENEMLIYEAEGINLVDVYYLIQAQVQITNTQSKLIKLLEENTNLKDTIKRLGNSINELEERVYGQPEY
tara:strand:- start:1550 stop:1804 length:255 start_codon:yes stop_codon:yes gene_type:complete